jgi:hypothetical protein
MPDVTPYWIPGDTITCHAAAAITGGRCVAVAGVRVGGNPQVSMAAAAAATILGVAARDAAIGTKVMVYAGPGTIVPITAGAAITAGALLEALASGAVVTRTTGIAIAQALDDAADTADVVARLL